MTAQILRLSILSAFLLGCQQNTKLSTLQWSINSGKSLPTIKNAEFSSSVSTVKVDSEIIERKLQKIGAATIDGSYFQKITTTKGNPSFIKASWEENIPKSLAEEANRLDVTKYALLESLKLHSVIFSKSSEIFTPQLMVEMQGKRAVLFWQIDLVDKSGLFVNRVRVNKAGFIEKITRVENCFSEARSLVFPSGPKFSDLHQEILAGLIGDGTLASDKIQLTSADGAAVTQPDGQFFFETDDFRFDQVQSFYFVQKTLNYAEKHWALSSPKRVSLQLRTGFPEKTNAAFYFNGNIRLGDGDNKTYSHIPRDPSIVSHEVGHFIIDNLSGMKPDGEAGSLNEGFADFLTATIWDNPLMGHTAYTKGSYKRNVENDLKYTDKNGGLYHDSLIVSSTLWEIRKHIGNIKAEKLALKTIARLGMTPVLADFKIALNDSLANLQLTTAELSSVASVLEKKGWP